MWCSKQRCRTDTCGTTKCGITANAFRDGIVVDLEHDYAGVTTGGDGCFFPTRAGWFSPKEAEALEELQDLEDLELDAQDMELLI